jgi:hypothetical protein
MDSTTSYDGSDSTGIKNGFAMVALRLELLAGPDQCGQCGTLRFA